AVAARPAAHSWTRGVADPHSKHRVSGGAGIADTNPYAIRGQVAVSLPALSTAHHFGESAPRLRRSRTRGRNRAARAGALRSPVAAVRRVPASPLAVAGA